MTRDELHVVSKRNASKRKVGMFIYLFVVFFFFFSESWCACYCRRWPCLEEYRERMRWGEKRKRGGERERERWGGGGGDRRSQEKGKAYSSTVQFYSCEGFSLAAHFVCLSIFDTICLFIHFCCLYREALVVHGQKVATTRFRSLAQRFGTEDAAALDAIAMEMEGIDQAMPEDCFIQARALLCFVLPKQNGPTHCAIALSYFSPIPSSVNRKFARSSSPDAASSSRGVLQAYTRNSIVDICFLTCICSLVYSSLSCWLSKDKYRRIEDNVNSEGTTWWWTSQLLVRLERRRAMTTHFSIADDLCKTSRVEKHPVQFLF